MDAKDLTLNIAVNLGRISRWAMEGKTNRVQQFLTETDGYLKQLDSAKRSDRFTKTYESFKRKFYKLKSSENLDEAWAEDVLTWANILTHRAKLA